MNAKDTKKKAAKAKLLRHRIYKKVLKHVKTFGWNWRGLCYYLTSLSHLCGYNDLMKTNFPEIWRRRPKHSWYVNRTYWFEVHSDRDEKRENILKAAIKATTPKPKTNGKRGISKRTNLSGRRKSSNRRG